MVARKHSIQVPRQHRVEDSVEDKTHEREVSGRHVELQEHGLCHNLCKAMLRCIGRVWSL